VKSNPILGETPYLVNVEQDDLKNTFDAIDTNKDG
jgi:hypothetical protein